MQYSAIIDDSPTRFGAGVPDRPRCGAVGSTRAEAVSPIRDAVDFRIEEIRERGLQIRRQSSTGYVAFPALPIVPAARPAAAERIVR